LPKCTSLSANVASFVHVLAFTLWHLGLNRFIFVTYPVSRLYQAKKILLVLYRALSHLFMTHAQLNNRKKLWQRWMVVSIYTLTGINYAKKRTSIAWTPPLYNEGAFIFKFETRVLWRFAELEIQSNIHIEWSTGSHHCQIQGTLHFWSMQSRSVQKKVGMLNQPIQSR